jgi:hypothetical protein
MARHGRAIGRRRAGVQTLELILAMPVIVVTLVAIVEFGTVQTVLSAVTHAATVGAREAGKGATLLEVASSVDGVLEPHGIDVVDGNAPVAGTKVLVETGALVEIFGDLSLGCGPPAAPILNADEVRVTVCIDLDNTPVLDVLCNWGFPFPGDCFRVSSVVKRE